MQWVEANEIRKKFGKVVALNSFSLNVRGEGITGLIGLNGAGKTTFLKILLGLIQPDSGEVALCGRKPQDPESREDVGYLTEGLSLPPHFTSAETVAFFGSLQRKKIRQKEAEQFLSRVNLEEACWHRPVRTLSKGQYQRVGLATALACGSSFLILDEPTTGLDAEGREEIKSLLQQTADAGISILLTSHILADIQEICDNIAIVHQGKNRYSGTVSDFLQIVGGKSLKDAFLSFIHNE